MFFCIDISAWDVSNVASFKQFAYGAKSFNQDLCVWGLNLYKDPAFDNMFESTNCPNQEQPDLENDPVGPFCHDCKDASEGMDVKDPLW